MRTDLLNEILFFLAVSQQRSGSDDDRAELARKIKNGDKTAFETFYRNQSGPLISFLRSKGLNQQEAEDLLQQAFLIIWENRADIDPNRSLRSFLFTTAYRRMLNLFRDSKNKVSDYAYILESDGQNPQEATETSEAMHHLHTALEEMPEKRRNVFELCYLQEFTYKEAAEALGVSRKTVENHMGLALKDLRVALKNFSPPGWG
jgi:RNA polymerase sigma-70 factor (ECF subfamily)